MHTFTHRRRSQPRKATASSSGSARIRCLAQGHLDTLGGAGERTCGYQPARSTPWATVHTLTIFWLQEWSIGHRSSWPGWLVWLSEQSGRPMVYHQVQGGHRVHTPFSCQQCGLLKTGRPGVTRPNVKSLYSLGLNWLVKDHMLSSHSVRPKGTMISVGENIG